MAKKAFEIQGSDLSLGGVSLQAGTTGVVIPGVTQAVNYRVEEVEDTDVDQTDTLEGAVAILDAVQFAALSANPNADISRYATYTVELDDDYYIDEIEVDSPGSYTQQEKTTNETTDMWAPGASGDVFDPFVAADWFQVPFRPKMRADEVESIGGSGGGSTLTNGDWQASLNDSGSLRVDNTDTEQNYFKLTSILNEDDTYGVLIDVNNQAGWTFLDNGNIQFPDGSIQTTAYTGTDSGTISTKLWIAAGSNPGGASVISSTDGIAWTLQDFILSNQNISRVAISTDKIVYLISNTQGPGSAIYYATAPENTPTMAAGTDVYGEGAIVNWEEVNYLGGKFVAVGSYEINNNTVSAGIVSITLAAGDRIYPQITIDNTYYNYSGNSIDISGATNTELNGTFILQYNSLDTLGTGVYDLTLDDGLGNVTAPTITSTDITGATIGDLVSVDGSSPVFAYSTNGVSWNYGDLDPTYILSFGGPASQLEMSDVAYNGTGYLIPVISNQFGDDIDNGAPSIAGPGAFYITDLTAPVGEEQFISGEGPSGLPGNFNNIAAYGDGTFFVSDDRYTVWTGNVVDGWTDHDIRTDMIAAYGWTPEGDNNENDVDSAVAGTVGDTEVWAGTTNAGMVVSTSDQGATFQFSIPDPFTAAVTVNQANPAVLDFSEVRQPQIWEKITITVANGDDTSWNGTYYVEGSGPSSMWALYDAVEGNAIDASAWTLPTNPLTVTFSYGRDLSAIHIADGACIVYSGDSSKLYRSTDLTTWTVVSNEGAFFVDDIYFSSIETAVTGLPTITIPAVPANYYKGLQASYGVVHSNSQTDELNVNKIVIHKPATTTVTIHPTGSDDDFQVSGLDTSDLLAMFVVYGDINGAKPLSDLQDFTRAVIDTVILVDGVENDFRTLEQMKTAFYANYSTLASVANGLAPNFRFYIDNVPTLNGGVTTVREGSGAIFDIANLGDGTYQADGLQNPGSNYLAGHKIKILGTDLGGATPDNDCIITIDEVVNGEIVLWSVSGTAAGTAMTSYTAVTGTNYNVGSGFTVSSVSRYVLSISVNAIGSNYVVGDVITLSGTNITGGTTPENDFIITVNAVDGLGQAYGYTATTGTAPDVWPTNSIDDGGDDQYDTANYINTDLATEIDYNDGDTVADGTAEFGTGSAYSVVYQDSIFGLFVTGNSADYINTSGNSGADGDSTTEAGSVFGGGTAAQTFDNAVTHLNIIGGEEVDGIRFSDGTRLESAEGVGRVKLESTGNRRIEVAYGYNAVSVTQRTTGSAITATAFDSNTGSTGQVNIAVTGTNLDALVALQNGSALYEIGVSADNINFITGTIGGGDGTSYVQIVFNNGATLAFDQGDTLYYTVTTGGDPVVWWDKSDLPGGSSDFRGAVIDYHAYTGDSTIIGTIHIVDDDGEENITHTEVQSGADDGENDDLWLVQNEGTISFRRIDGDSHTLKIQWTARVFYGSETYD